MAFRNMTGTTCSPSGVTITFVADDTGASVNDVFQLSDGRCVTLISSGATTTEKPTVNLSIKFASCAACLAPYSSNTEQVITYILNSDISNGTPTIRTFVPPHPVWTDNQNHGVVQMNAITIGGNGLNS
jgi:hypothetical protein